jgi:hypothetical protein
LIKTDQMRRPIIKGGTTSSNASTRREQLAQKGARCWCELTGNFFDLGDINSLISCEHDLGKRKTTTSGTGSLVRTVTSPLRAPERLRPSRSISPSPPSSLFCGTNTGGSRKPFRKTVWRSCIARHPTNFAEENSRFLCDTLEVEGTAYLCRESPLPQLACARARGLSEVSAPAGHDGQQKASVGMPCAREGRPPLRQTKRKNKKRKWCIRRSVATTTRQRRDRLKGHPQERQHSAAEWRDAGPSAPGEEHRMTCVRDGSPKGGDVCGYVHDSPPAHARGRPPLHELGTRQSCLHIQLLSLSLILLASSGFPRTSKHLAQPS